MSNRKNLSQSADEIVDFIDKNPTDTARKSGGRRDVSTEPRVPKGSADGGQWTSGGGEGGGGSGQRTSGGGNTAPSEEELQKQCPNGSQVISMLVTGYTDGPESTGKRPGDPGYAKTSHGTKTAHGTIAASPEHSFGTRMYVPGYGWGTVQDRGGKIKGNHIDLWFKTVKEAKKWGKRTVNVVVCKK